MLSTRPRSSTPLARQAVAALVAAIGIAAAALAMAGGTRAGTSHTVEIADFAFMPQVLTIQVGDTVTWTNLDQVEHTATSTAGDFDSGLLGQNESYSVTFTEPGTYSYLCTPHPSMTGQIVVQAAPAPTPTPSQATGGGGAIPDVAMTAPGTGPIDLRLPLGMALLAGALAAALLLRRRAANG
jgi:amicyanin